MDINTDNESVSSWNETTDDETDIDEITYEPEEISLTKYNIVLCERYNSYLHGKSREAEHHYLTQFRLRKLDINFIAEIKRIYPRIRLEISECIYLNTEQCISIIKTHWLRLIQRTWKRIYKEQKNIIKRRCNLNSIKYREIKGKWPNDCINYPMLKGMLSYLS